MRGYRAGEDTEERGDTVIMVWMRRWVLLMIGLPVLAWVLDNLAGAVEQRRGRSDVTRGMRGAAERMRRFRQRRRRGRGGGRA